MVLCLPLQIHIKTYIAVIILLHLKKNVLLHSYVLVPLSYWLVDWLVCSQKV